MDSVKSTIEYYSNERRNALRVTPVGHTLNFDEGSFKLPCIDISVDGIALENDGTLPTIEDEVVAFVMDQDGNVIGQVKARLVYKQATRSGWKFTAMEDSVREFVETLVLNTQKESLREAAVERMKEQERELLGLEEKE